MADFDETGDFDRLAGQPDDPIAGTREIVSSTEAIRGETGLVLGDVSLTDLSQVEQPRPESSPLPWFVVGGLVVVILVLVFAFLLPAQSSVTAVEDELETTRAEVVRLREDVARLTAERDEAVEARTSLEAEAEARAGEMEKMARDAEVRDAEKRKAATQSPKPKRKKKKRRRR